MHCSTGQGKMHSPLFSGALQNRLTASLCHCNYTYGDSLFIQVCSEATEMHYNTGKGKMHSPLFSSALENRLTAGLCHCNYTCGGLLFIPVCSEATEMHCSTGKGKMHSPIMLCSTAQGKINSPVSSAGLQNRLTAIIVSLQIHLGTFAAHTSVQ